MKLKLTSIQAPNQDFIIAGIAECLAARLDLTTSFVHDLSWQERERLLDKGQIHIGWICGLPYIQKVERDPQRWELLAAPVMKGARYGKRPVYFSDVIVHKASRFMNFGDLRGASWAYNEPNSHSGYNVVRYYLSGMGEDGDYFGAVHEAGSHENALAMVLEREIDAAAIDSTVLELAINERPEINEQIRIVSIIGPSPIPPLIISRQLSGALRRQIRTLLLVMHKDPLGQALLEKGLIERYVLVEDSDYGLIREMERLGRQVKLIPLP